MKKRKADFSCLKEYPAHVVQRFIEYHEAHPEVFKLFIKYANDMRAAGRTQYSAEIITNMIRWHHDIKNTKGEPFKINNDFKPMYARLLANEYPAFKDFFQFRQVRSLGIGSREERDRSA